MLFLRILIYAVTISLLSACEFKVGDDISDDFKIKRPEMPKLTESQKRLVDEADMAGVINAAWVKRAENSNIENSSPPVKEDSCLIPEGAVVSILEVTEKNSRIFYYRRPNPDMFGGSLCTIGEVTWISNEVIDTWPSPDIMKAKFDSERDNNINEVNRILSKVANEEALEEIRVVSSGWVPVAIETENNYHNGMKMLKVGDTCVFNDNGTMKVLGVSDTLGTLVRYLNSGDTFGSPCPNGTLAWLESGKMPELTMYK